MELFDLFFYIFATVIVISGAVTVLNKNLIYAAFALLVLLSSVAAMFFILGAEFLAVEADPARCSQPHAASAAHWNLEASCGFEAF